MTRVESFEGIGVQEIAPPEPDLAPGEMVQRARAMRSALRERQDETERLTHHAIRRALDGLRSDLARMLDEGVRGGWVRADLDTPLFADLMLGLLLGGREHAARTGRPVDELAREVERIALDGIRARG